MKLNQQTIGQLAELLENAELQAHDVVKITDAHPEMDWDDAYAIQAEILRRKLARGNRVVGLKAGLTSHAKMKQMGVETPCFGFLMMSHMNTPAGLIKQARLMEGYGANCIYVTDSAGYMLPDDVWVRLSAVRDALKPETELGFHGHHPLAMGVANSIAAVEAGANRIDAAAAGLGAGAGNTPMEVFIAVCDRMGIETGVDTFKICDVAEDRVVPIMDHIIRVDRDSLTLGYAGVYSSFLLFAKRAEKKYGISARDILVELGRRGMVGGQEDMIEDTAMTMARAKGLV